MTQSYHIATLTCICTRVRGLSPQCPLSPSDRAALRVQVTYYDDIGDAYEWAVQLPVEAISLDFLGVPGSALGNETAALIEKHGFPSNKRLGAGVVDGRSVFADGEFPGKLIAALQDKVGLLKHTHARSDTLVNTAHKNAWRACFHTVVSRQHMPVHVSERLH